MQISDDFKDEQKDTQSTIQDERREKTEFEEEQETIARIMQGGTRTKWDVMKSKFESEPGNMNEQDQRESAKKQILKLEAEIH